MRQIQGPTLTPLVQVCASDGELLLRDALLIAGEQVKVWIAGSAQQGVGAPTQSVALPSNVGAFVRPSVSKAECLQAQQHQGVWVTDDQMRFALDGLPVPVLSRFRLWIPCIFSGACIQSPRSLKLVLAAQIGDNVISALWCRGHWICMHWQVRLWKVVSWMSAPPGMQCEEVAIADWLFSKAAGCRDYLFQAGPVRPMAPGLCGHFAIADPAARLQGRGEVSVSQALDHSAHAMAVFQFCMPEFCRAPTLIAGVLSPLVEQSLVVLLKERGACEGDLQAWASLLITRLGADTVQRALSSPSPWKQLKAVASLSSQAVQLILPSELQRQIEARGHDGPGNRQGKKKQAKQAKVAASHASAQVQIPTGVFINGSTGILLGRLQVGDLCPQAEGVVLVSPAEALPYLALEKPVSSEALALLVLGEIAVPAHAQCSRVRFQAAGVESGEPLLLNATLIQIGQSPVAKSTPAQMAPSEIPRSVIARLAVFRDQWPGAWPDFVQGPVKAIIQSVSCLKTCNSPGCSFDGRSRRSKQPCLTRLSGFQSNWNCASRRHRVTLTFTWSREREMSEVFRTSSQSSGCRRRRTKMLCSKGSCMLKSSAWPV